MKRVLVNAMAVAAAVAAVAGCGIWLVVRHHHKQLPEISAYSDGHLVRVGPYRYCEVLNLNNCQDPQSQGELEVTAKQPVQLSVPTAIGRVPWRLLQVYEDPRDTAVTYFAPGTRLAVTVPTVDPHRGRLTGIAVQLLTLVLDETGEVADVPHAEWSVRTVW